MKRRILPALMAASAIAGGIGTATAADVAPYYRAPPVVVPYYSWNGFYIGANVGGAWSNNDALWSPLPASAAFGVFPIAGNTGGSSAIGGFQAGYNWQFAPTWAVSRATGPGQTPAAPSINRGSSIPAGLPCLARSRV